jgi:hypothetical protein
MVGDGAPTRPTPAPEPDERAGLTPHALLAAAMVGDGAPTQPPPAPVSTVPTESPTVAALDRNESEGPVGVPVGAIAAAASLPGELKPDELLKAANAQLFGRMCEIVAAAFRGASAVAAARETVEAVFRELRPEFAAAGRGPERRAGSSQNPADDAGSTPE